MKRKTLMLTSITLLLLALFSCQTSQKESTIIINLDSNPSTGYSWQLEISGEGEAELIEESYEEKNRMEYVTGAPGVETFVLQPTKAGELKLTFSYLRPWEEGIPAEEIKTFTYQIKEDLSFTLQ